MQTVSLSLFRFRSVPMRIWAFGMMGLSRLLLPRIEDIQFWKLCGAGAGEGFDLLPDTSVCAILAIWPDEDTARTRIEQSKVFKSYRQRANENWTLFLNPISARGKWSGTSPFQAEDQAASGPIAALTRATLKPSIAVQFWKQVPDISRVVGSDENVMFKIGMGEVPYLQQITFSVWPDTDAMANFARKDGPHARAIRSVRDGKWFREELYARFRITGEVGSWEGRSPRISTEGLS